MKAVFLILLVFLFNSCFNQGDCLITSTNLIKINLRSKDDGKSKSATFLQVREVTDLIEFPAYELIGISALQLPMNPKRLDATFVFLTSDSVVYHLNLTYSTFSRVVSPDCGAFLYYKDLSVTETDFDRTKIINPQLFKSVTTNLEIFF